MSEIRDHEGEVVGVVRHVVCGHMLDDAQHGRSLEHGCLFGIRRVEQAVKITRIVAQDVDRIGLNSLVPTLASFQNRMRRTRLPMCHM